MKLEQQVVSLELAQKLKELGVKQESLFYWCGSHSNPDAPWGIHNWSIRDKEFRHWSIRDKEFRLRYYQSDDPVSAFTVAELGEILKNGGACSFYQGLWCCTYVSEDGRSHKEGADTEADARAKMLVYLLENKLI